MTWLVLTVVLGIVSIGAVVFGVGSPAGSKGKAFAVAGGAIAIWLVMSVFLVAALLMVGLVSYGSVRLFAHPGRGSTLALPGDLAGGSFPLSFSPSLSPSAQTISTRLPAPATLRGRLVCVHCLLSERYHLQSDCLHQGHRGALLLNDGTLVFFMDGTDEKLRRSLRHQAETERACGRRRVFVGDEFERDGL